MAGSPVVAAVVGSLSGALHSEALPGGNALARPGRYLLAVDERCCQSVTVVRDRERDLCCSDAPYIHQGSISAGAETFGHVAYHRYANEPRQIQRRENNIEIVCRLHRDLARDLCAGRHTSCKLTTGYITSMLNQGLACDANKWL
eukprot:GHVU01212441.1.p2 GENE.GHVU01212441.1~~GHVU01212441.1.p2  ORF type:complete len:145 (+),score=0.70 GHVU01212441.1:1005-1439(+)